MRALHVLNWHDKLGWKTLHRLDFDLGINFGYKGCWKNTLMGIQENGQNIKKTMVGPHKHTNKVGLLLLLASSPECLHSTNVQQTSISNQVNRNRKTIEIWSNQFRFRQTNSRDVSYFQYCTAEKIKTLTITYCITLAWNADGKHHQSVQEGKHQLMPSEFLRCCKGTMHEAVLAKPKYLAKHQRGNPGGSYDWLLHTKISAKPAKLLKSRGSNKVETWFKPRVLKFCE